jgi:hypothetical protein
MIKPAMDQTQEASITPAVLLYDGKAGNREKIRGRLVGNDLMTVECETLKQLRLNFKHHSKIFDGVIYDSGDCELKERFVIQNICEFLRIPCFSVEEYLKSPEDFEKLVRKV